MLARPEIGTPAHILLWLAGKPADQEYNWSSYFDCACGQYSREHGMDVGRGWLDGLGPLNMEARERPWTFGALYERASKAWRENAEVPV